MSKVIAAIDHSDTSESVSSWLTLLPKPWLRRWRYCMSWRAMTRQRTR